MRKGTDGNRLRTHFTNGVQKSQLLFDRNVGALDLQAFSHRVIEYVDGLGH
jgi:hypothetical protein